MPDKSFAEVCQLVRDSNVLILWLCWIIFPLMLVFWTFVGIITLIIRILLFVLGWAFTPFFLIYRAIKE